MGELTAVQTENGSQYELRQAVLVYELPGGSNRRPAGPAIVTVHPVLYADGNPEIGPGVEASDAFLRRLHRSLSPKRARHEACLHFLDSRVLGHSSDALVWHCPSHRRAMVFHSKDPVEKLSGRQVLHPHLLFLLHGSALRVFALRTAARPTLETQLFFAPYYNTNDNGNVCWGSVKLPSRLTPDLFAEWENTFLDSAFTHLAYREKFIRFRGGHHGLWRAMAKPGARRFPSNALVSAGLTVGDLLDGRRTASFNR